MGLLSNFLGGLLQNSNRKRNDDDDYSEEDYNFVQDRFREIYDAQQAGDKEKAQELWDKFKDDTGYEV